MAYTVDPNNSLSPLDTDDASYMAAEFRAMKAKMQTQIVGTVFTSGGTADAITGTLPTTALGVRVTTVPPGANTLTNPTLNGVLIVKYNASGMLIPLVAGDYNATTAFTFVFSPLGYAGADCWILNLNSASVSASGGSSNFFPNQFYPTF